MRRLVLSISLTAAVAVVASCQVNEQQKQQASTRTADCDRVAETLASFEIGNYATKEKRAPIVAKQRDACKAARVTAAEATCLETAKDTWAAKACVPSMFPPAGGKADCKQAVVRMREAFASAIGSGDGSATAQLEVMLPVIQLSCEQDQWPASVTGCMVATKSGDMPAFQACAAQLPKELQDKMARRMLAREQQK